jgi:heavy metal translocating P-type ATPase
MSCASCVGRIERALAAAPGVLAASANLATGRARVTAAPGAATGPILAAARDAGYAPRLETIRLAVEGMSCAACVGRVERALAAVPGVVGAAVNLAAGSAAVEAAEGAVAPEALIAAAARAGYVARPAAEAGAPPARAARATAQAEEAAALRRQAALAAALTAPLVLLEMGAHLLPALHHRLLGIASPQALDGAAFALATLVLFGPGRRIFAAGVRALRRAAPDMNSLVTIGAGAAWAYSVVASFAPGALPAGADNVYFEAAAVIVTLVLAGRWLEAVARGRTSSAIAALVRLQPRQARLVRDGEERDVPVEDVAPGDVLRVRPGERVPVDGVVLDGSSYVDEAMITGEPAPAAKAAGAAVTGGTINQTGSFTFRAEKVGADTLLAQIVRMVEAAQGDKLPIQALVDRVTLWFVPAVIAAAALTFALWLALGPAPALGFALVNAVAVLIIACPCAMGLATPTSIMVGVGRGAAMGVLFRRGDALQTLRDARAIALDKTGTLTLGRPALTDLETAPGVAREAALARAAAAEAGSEHPIAAAILAAARGLARPEARDFAARPGYGVEARVEGRRVLVGADRLMAAEGLDVAPFAATAARLAAEGKTPLYLGHDGRVEAVLAVADPLKPTSAEAIRALHALGLRVAMLTGDDARTARAIADRLGVDEVVAEVPPGGKVEAVRALQAAAGRLIFVGDGINDAPALAQADVGIAIGAGADVAIEAAEVVLISGDLRGVVNAIALSRATMANIRQNLAWAFGYNAALIPVAAGLLWPAFGVLLSPVLAAFAMALSSVSVLGNALRLRGFRPPLAPAARGAGAGP